MGEARVSLLLMDGDGRLTERFFPDANGETAIQLANERWTPFHAREESQVESSKQLARFYTSQLRVILEPFVEGVTIEPAYPDAAIGTSDGRWVVPPSNLEASSHHYFHLRPEDVIHFENHNLQIRYSLQQQKSQKEATPVTMPAVISNDNEGGPLEGIQVRSSDAQRGGEVVQQDSHSGSETEEDAEDDIDRKNTPQPVATPATSRPTDTNEIKETPHHEPAEEEAPFSTAVDEQSDGSNANTAYGVRSDEIKLTTDIDFADADDRLAGGSKTARPVSRMLSFSEEEISQQGRPQQDVPEQDNPQQSGLQQGDDLPQGADLQQDDDSQQAFPSSPGLPKKTYSHRSRRSTPAGNDAAADAQTDDAGANSDAPTIPPTSQAVHPEGTAREVAKRSLKRKPTQETDEGGENIRKARKTTPPDEEDTTATSNKQTEARAVEEESDDDGPSQIDAGPRVLSGSSGRLPRVARANQEELEDDSQEEADEDEDEESADEVIVARPKKTSTRQKSSPDTIVRPQRASKSASKTPGGTPQTPNSTAASSIPGKSPKIVVSNITGNYGGNSALAKFIKAQGSSIVSSVPSRRTNFLCMVKDDKTLMKTPKVLRSLALGKQIVTERWITESKVAGELLDPANFIHQEVAKTMDMDRRKLFFGKVVYFTSAVVKEYGDANWTEMKALAMEAGASSVESGNGDKGGQIAGRNSVLYIGAKPDKDVTVLTEDYSRVVFHKDLIKEAVVSGELDLEDGRHKLDAAAAAGGKSKKTGRR